MMKIRNFILSIIRKLEASYPGLIAYSYEEADRGWHVISVSDYKTYMQDTRFRKLRKAWVTAAKVGGHKLVFICGWTPTENDLLRLATQDNLIIDV